MKKRVCLILLVLSLSLLLFACGGGQPCDECVDNDLDGLCDECGEEYKSDDDSSTHRKCYDKNPKDGICDKCGKEVPCDVCVDVSPKDAECDICAKEVPCVTHTNNNEDTKCDVCGKNISACADGDHVDENESGVCDKCGKTIDADAHDCIDESPRDAKCDICNADMPCDEHVNSDEDRRCDICTEDIPVCRSCIDANKNAKCDICGSAVACAVCVDEDPKDSTCDVCGKPIQSDAREFKVTLTYTSAHVIFDDEAQKNVAEGGSVSFSIKIKDGYIFKSVSHGVYDQASGVLTITDISRATTVIFTTEEAGYDTSATFTLVLRKESNKDSCYPKASSGMKMGTQITFTAGNYDMAFIGWSLGSSYEDGGEIVSTSREFVLVATPDVVTGSKLYVYPNYRDSRTYYYDLNGGSVDTFSDNMKATKYYTATKDGATRVKVTLGDKYYSFAEAASTFYNDGSFYRDGYVLKEYNTKADGSGDKYGLGAKYSAKSDGTEPVLYCIWEKATDGFTYDDYIFARPSGVTVANSPEWNESGVIITGYDGADKTVVIPDKIGNKPVIAIAAGAFVNRPMETLVMGRHLLSVADGAIVGCSNLKEIYYSDGIYSISNNALDTDSYTSLKKLYVNATIAPRFANSTDGAFAVKLAKLLSTSGEDRVIIISGSSSYQGIATEYMEALFGGKYKVINFGTTRTTHGTIYLEAMQAFAHHGDVIVYSPENSAYMLGESELYWKTLRDIEGMYNMFTHIDISNYTNVFGAFAELNQQYRYLKAPRVYEQICENTGLDKNGDRVSEKLNSYNDDNEYSNSYVITFNNRITSKYEFKNGTSSKDEITWKDEEAYDKNYNDPTSIRWCNLDDADLVGLMNKAIASAKKSGAKVYFGFCPIDANSIAAENKNKEALLKYDALIASLYDFDGLLGSCQNYIFAHQYFFDCAFHTNYYGKVLRTYRLYVDLADVCGITDIIGMTDYGTSFDNCLFEETSDGLPRYKVSFLK